MGREYPMNPSPAGKPSIKTIQSVTSKGQMIPPRGSHGTGYAQVSSSTAMPKGNLGSGATSKGKISMGVTPGSEYRQESF